MPLILRQTIAVTGLVVCSVGIISGQARGTTKPSAPTQINSRGSTASQPAKPQSMTNADVLQMVSAKLADDIIVNAIESARDKSFDLSAPGLIALKTGGVSDAVIRAMQGKPASAPSPATAVAPVTAAPAASSARPEPVAPAAPPAGPENKGNAVGRVFGGIGRTIGLGKEEEKTEPSGANKVRALKNGEAGIIRTQLDVAAATAKVRSYLESQNLRIELSGETLKSDWGAPEKCPGFTAAQCQWRADVQIRSAENGATTVSVWVIERRRNRGTNDWGERGAIGDRTGKLATELEKVLDS